MSDLLPRLATEQRGRLVGSLMGYLERDVYPKLTAPERKALREKVLSSVGVYHDFVLDALRAAGDGDTVLNEQALRLLQQIHNEVRRT